MKHLKIFNVIVGSFLVTSQLQAAYSTSSISEIEEETPVNVMPSAVKPLASGAATFVMTLVTVAGGLALWKEKNNRKITNGLIECGFFATTCFLAYQTKKIVNTHMAMVKKANAGNTTKRLSSAK